MSGDFGEEELNRAKRTQRVLDKLRLRLDLDAPVIDATKELEDEDSTVRRSGRARRQVSRMGTEKKDGEEEEKIDRRDRIAHYDQEGRLMARGTEERLDLCDCLILECPGCWFPSCKSCGGKKCSNVCRVNRHQLVVKDEDDNGAGPNLCRTLTEALRKAGCFELERAFKQEFGKLA